MNKFLLISFIGLFLFFSPQLYSQNTKLYPLSFSKNSNILIPAKRFDNPLADTSTLNFLNDIVDSGKDIVGVNKENLEFNPKNSGVWEDFKNGQKVWRLTLVSDQATGINLTLRDVRIPSNCKVFVYNIDKTVIHGPYTSEHNNEYKTLVLPYTTGDTTIVEVNLFNSIGLVSDQEIFFNINRLTHRYEKAIGTRNAGSCNIDVNCPQGDEWQCESKGVARIEIPFVGIRFLQNMGTSGVTRIDTVSLCSVCSGSLINNTRQDCFPYFLTADHCLLDTTNYLYTDLSQNYIASVVHSKHDAITDNDLSDWSFYWNYEGTGCNDTDPPIQSTSGAVLLANTDNSDFALLDLIEDPNTTTSVDPKPYFNGWSRFSPGLGGVGIHHPDGDVKKISTHNITPRTLLASDNIDVPGVDANYWMIEQWQSGVTEGGSSGSPLFNEVDKLIVGQLFGGDRSDCAAVMGRDTGAYGKISASWLGIGTLPERRLQPWLDPLDLDVQFLRGSEDPCCESTTADASCIESIEVSNIQQACNGDGTFNMQFTINAPFSEYVYNQAGNTFSFDVTSDNQIIIVNTLDYPDDPATYTFTISNPNNSCSETYTFTTTQTCPNGCDFDNIVYSTKCIDGDDDNFYIDFVFYNFTLSTQQYRVLDNDPSTANVIVQPGVPECLGPYPNNTSIVLTLENVSLGCSETLDPVTRDCSIDCGLGMLSYTTRCNATNSGYFIDLSYTGTGGGYTITAGYDSEINTIPNNPYTLGFFSNGTTVALTIFDPIDGSCILEELNISANCSSSSLCGNGIADPGETCETCPQDLTTCLVVTAPTNSGICYEDLENLEIRWQDGSSINDEIIIEVCNDNTGTCDEIAATTPDNGVFNWTVGTLVSGGTLPFGSYYVKIYDPANTPNNNSSNVIFNYSGDCSSQPVENAGIQNSLDCYDLGTIANITWTAGGSLNNEVTIEICEVNGMCNVIESSAPDNGSYSWNIGVLEGGGTTGEGNFYLKLYDPFNTSNPSISNPFELSIDCDECVLSLTCPENITVSTDPGSNSASVSWIPPTPPINCTNVSLSSTHDPGDSFSRGFTTVVYTLTNNDDGSTTTCAFDVIVQDNEPPTFSGPSSLGICTEMDQCYGEVPDLSNVIDVEDNGSEGEITGQNPAPGTLFGAMDGDQITVTLTAEDDDGNESEFEVTLTLIDCQNPEFVNCPTSDYVFNLDSDACTASANWSIPVPDDNCSYMFTQTAGPPSGSDLPRSGSPYYIEYTVYDDNGNTDICFFDVIIVDNVALQFQNCPDTLIFGTDPDQCDVYANWSIPVATDNCDVTVTHISGPQPGDELVPGTYTVEYQAVNNDTPPEMATCEFTVIVYETQNPELNCPQDITVSNDPGVCEAVVNNIQLEFAFDNCPYTVTWTSSPVDVTGTGTSTTDDASGAIFPVGIHTVTYTITETDDFGNGILVDSCQLIVTVIDDELPMITCPADAVIGTSMGGTGDCQGEYTWNHPTPTDNCGVSVYNITYTNPDTSIEGPLDILGMEGASITRIFDLGITEILYHVEDTTGNVMECTFTVEVLDDENPVIYCDSIVVCNTYSTTQFPEILPLDIVTSVINVPNDLDIIDVNILSLQGTMPDMGSLKLTLTSPSGTTITLFDATCAGTPDFDLSLDDAAANGVGAAPCTPFGNGATYLPQELLAAFDMESSLGDWTLTMENTAGYPCGLLTNWELEICGNKNDPATMINTLSANVDPGTCSYKMTDTIFDPPFDDNCPGPFITHNGIMGPFNHTLQGAVFPLGQTPITWTVTDQAGNTTTCEIIIEVLDNEAPVFTNCPRPDIVTDEEPGTCGAYVNFSLPLATDNCPVVNVVQTDATGLNSGSIFPVGKTTLEWTATDAAGNTAVCSVNIIVNDTEAPEIDCRPDLTVDTDPWTCEAVVTDLAPTTFADNCVYNSTITYEVEYPSGSGQIVACGIDDASGLIFQEGVSTITYRIQETPLLLITEATQEVGALNGTTNPLPPFINTINGDDYVEISNFGHAALDVSCLNIERISTLGSENFIVPNGTNLLPGRVLTLHYGNGTDAPTNLFFNLKCAGDLRSSDPAAYVISYGGIVLDVLTVNGFDPVGQSLLASVIATDWSGTISAANRGAVYRHCVYDHNDATDFLPADVCMPATIGTPNPDLPTPSYNGQQAALQNVPIKEATCSFTLTVEDNETPYCGEFIDQVYTGATNLSIPGSITGGAVFRSEINVGDNFTIGDVDLLNINGAHTNMSDLIFKLTSPSGTQAVLFGGLCDGTADFDFNLDSDSLTAITSAPCMPLGQGGFYAPVGSLKDFYGENSQGTWVFEIADTVMTNDGQLNNWELLLSEIQTYSQTDTIIPTEPGLCSAEFTWVHPMLIDNCCEGTIEVRYESLSPIALPTGGIVVGGAEAIERFEGGVTTVKYILTDASGNVDSCSFDVTVDDVEDPVVMCPADIIQTLDPGDCEVVVNYVVTATDNCEVDTIIQIDTSGFTSGDLFPIGITTQQWVAIDTSGNTDTCSFDIEILEFVPTNYHMSCNNSINISLDTTCVAEITADMILEGNNYGCYDDYEVTVSYEFGGPIPTSPVVTFAELGLTLRVEIYDPETGVSCWGYILVEDKQVPIFDCPADTLITCNASIDPMYLGRPVLIYCEQGVTMVYNDVYTDFGQCGDPRMQIERTWIVTDASGNAASCLQTIQVEAFDLTAVIFPPHLDNIDAPALSCEAVANDPDLILPEHTGQPTIDAWPVELGGWCSVSMNYTDWELDICASGASYEILRTWTIRNLCAPLQAGVNPIQHVQAIQILDSTPPEIQVPDAITISTDAWQCAATWYPPTPILVDACSPNPGSYSVSAPIGDLDTLPSGVLVFNDLPLGVWPVTYTAVDDCGNIAQKVVQLSVEDLVPPNVVCETSHTTSITTGEAVKIFAAAFDDGTVDVCNPTYFKVIRMDDLLGTNDGSNSNQGTTECDFLNGDDNPNRFGNQIYFDDWVKFCCEDIADPDLMVVLRVFDRDPGDGPVDPSRMRTGGDLYGHFNDCMVDMVVEDKIPPFIQCPDDITVACDFWFDRNDLSSTFGTVRDNLADVQYIVIDGVTVGQDGIAGDNCSVTISENAVDNLTCGQGVITRIFTATDRDGRTASCVQRITIVDNDPYFINDTNCFNFDAQDGVRWPCDYNASTCGAATDPSVAGEPQIFNDDNCTLITVTHDDEEFPVVADACFKIKRIWTVTDWCTFDQFDSDNNDVYDPTDDGVIAGQWEYVQYIKVLNSQAPVFAQCLDTIICGYNTDCKVRTMLSNTVEDDCTPEELLVVDFKIDLDNDGSFDLVGANVSPYPYPNPNGLPMIPVTYLDNGTGGYEMTVTAYDYPVGVHRILWSSEDVCSNIGTCEYLLDMRDCAKPTPKAFHGLAVDIQPVTQEALVTAVMMDAGSFDNCCLAPDPFRIGYPSGGPNQTNPPTATQVIFGCQDLGTQAVDLWVEDCNGNWDYVISYVNVQDNMNACGTPGLSISGTVENEQGAAIAGVNMQLVGTGLNMPGPQVTGLDGTYGFTGLEINNNYVLTPDKDIDYRNGVSILDIILISRHLTGLQPFDSPYKYIAADIDHSESVNTFDIIELQKLLLFINNEFPDNTSWRFVEDSHTFSDPSNPWSSPFPEVLTVNGLTTNAIGDFTAVKIGDVNGDALTNAVDQAKDRTFDGELRFRVKDLEIQSDASHTVEFKAQDFEAILGYQFTIEFDTDALEILEVIPGVLPGMSQQNFGLAFEKKGVLTSSYASHQAIDIQDEETLFTIVFKGKESISLSEVLDLSSRYTPSVAYDEDFNSLDVGIDFEEVELTILPEFTLYQNQPNPFKEITTIGFVLPEAGNIRFTIYDVSGRLMKVIEGEYAKGYNEIAVTQSELPVKGLLFYQLDCEQGSAIRKMIVAE